MIIKQLKQFIINNKEKRFIQSVLSTVFSNNLNILAILFNSDKWRVQGYTKHYQKYFSKFKNKSITLLEIGVGGYKDPEKGGASLKMWKVFFKKAKIVAIDIEDKTALCDKRTFVYKGNQTDENLLLKLARVHGPFEIIIDDGSHVNSDVIFTFNYLFPSVKEGGYYIIEDTQTSYFAEKYGGGMEGNTIMNYFKQLTDSLNYREFPIKGYTPTYFDKNIIAIHFYHNLIVIEKGRNNEESNIIKDGIRIDL